MSFRIAVDNAHAVVMGKSAAQEVAKIVNATLKAAGRGSVTVIEPSPLIATHNNPWAAAKSIINRL